MAAVGKITASSSMASRHETHFICDSEKKYFHVPKPSTLGEHPKIANAQNELRIPSVREKKISRSLTRSPHQMTTAIRSFTRFFFRSASIPFQLNACDRDNRETTKKSHSKQIYRERDENKLTDRNASDALNIVAKNLCDCQQ